MSVYESIRGTPTWPVRLRGIRGGRHLVDHLARASDLRRNNWISRSIRWTGVLGQQPIPSYWWNGQPNFGDQLSPAVIGAMTGYQPVLVSAGFSGKLLAVGSVLAHAQTGDVIWGAGLLRDQPFDLPPRVEVLAVRGPMTRQLITADIPEIYGDPALLLPDFYRPVGLGSKPVGVVPHLSERDVVGRIGSDEILGIDVSSPWQDVVAKIVSCELVLTSSLHGIIVADAYNIPCSWIQIRGGIRGGDFKFMDYFASTHRDPIQPHVWDPLRPKLDSIAVLSKPIIDLEPLRKSMRSYVKRIQSQGHSPQR